MPKKISVNLKRQWLAEFEQGKSIVEIARKHNNDPRTVTVGIDLARRLRMADVAQLEVLKMALLRHQEALMLTLDGLVKECRFPMANTELKRWLIKKRQLKGELDEVAFDTDDEVFLSPTQGRSLDEEYGALIVPRLAVEDEATWPLLLEHLKQDELIEKIKSMKELYGESNIAELRLQHKTAVAIRHATGLKISDDKNCSPCVRSVSAQFIWQSIIGEHRNKEISNVLADTASGKVVTEEGIELGVAPGNEAKLKSDLFKALDVIKGSDELKQFLKISDESKAAINSVKILAEQLKSIGMVSGVCSICARLGIEG